MPIHERDPWRLQYFTHVQCPADTFIPTDDGDAYRWNAAHRHIYNKLIVAESQGLQCAPHGIAPTHYPVFSKPIFNLDGMGVGSRVLRDARDYDMARQPGHMWMTHLSGEHVSTDIAVLRGRVQWLRHVVGVASGGGTFDYWTVEAATRPALDAYCAQWIESVIPDYTGMMNIESIGGRIIEAHLRFADQWPDLYGAGWLDAVVALYARGTWTFEERTRIPGYSVVLFGPHERRYRHPDPPLVAAICAREPISSVQITFHEGTACAAHAMPPGGFRLAIINTHDLAAGLEARDDLAQACGLQDRVSVLSAQ